MHSVFLQQLTTEAGYNMIKNGSTIAMEAWDMKYKPNSDWNHAWGAALQTLFRDIYGEFILLSPDLKELLSNLN